MNQKQNAYRIFIMCADRRANYTCRVKGLYVSIFRFISVFRAWLWIILVSVLRTSCKARVLSLLSACIWYQTPDKLTIFTVIRELRDWEGSDQTQIMPVISPGAWDLNPIIRDGRCHYCGPWSGAIKEMLLMFHARPTLGAVSCLIWNMKIFHKAKIF